MRDYIQKHKVTAFYISVLAVSGLLLTIQSQFSWANLYSLSLPQLAPTLSVLILCLVTKDSQPRAQIYQHMPLSRKDIPWILAILALAVLVVDLTAGTLTWLGYPYAKWNGTLVNAIIMLGGCFFEEIGWRGFMLPQLERSYNPFMSTLIVGFLWGVWHLSFNLGLLGFAIFVVTAIEMSLVMTWIYHKTNGNLILMALWHFVINLLNQVLLTERLTAVGFGVFATALIVPCAIAIYKNKAIFFSLTS